MHHSIWSSDYVKREDDWEVLSLNTSNGWMKLPRWIIFKISLTWHCCREMTQNWKRSRRWHICKEISFKMLVLISPGQLRKAFSFLAAKLVSCSSVDTNVWRDILKFCPNQKIKVFRFSQFCPLWAFSSIFFFIFVLHSVNRK